MQSNRLFRYFVALSVTAVPAIVMVAGAGLRHVLRDLVIQDAQVDAVQLASAIRDLKQNEMIATGPDGRLQLTLAQDNVDQLDREMRTFLRRFEVLKINIYSLDGQVIYSTGQGAIGDHGSDSSDLAAALAGQMRSTLYNRDTALDFRGRQRTDVDLVETYIPVTADGGKIVGCFELCTDVTPYIKAQTITLIRCMSLLLAILVAVFGLLSAMMRRSTDALETSRQKLRRLNQSLEKVIQQRTRALMKTRDAVIFGLAKLAESRDDDTGDHIERIREYVQILAEHLADRHGLDSETIETMGLASSLHDIGKVGIPDSVLLKPGRLTPQERAVIQKHTTIGGDCLLSIKQRLGEDDFLETACEIALAHHERWDGGGYPYGLKGTQIPLAARIVSVADVYDALTSQRVYKDAMPHEQAKQLILNGCGTQFDPEIVEAFTVCEADILRVRSAESVEVDPAQEQDACSEEPVALAF